MAELPLYFDNSATTPLCAAAKDAFLRAAELGGNPSSLHGMGAGAAALLEESREILAQALHTRRERIFFTSGGTEANNLALFGAAEARKRLGRRIVTTAAEHASVYEPMKELEKRGFEVVFLKPDRQGRFSASEIDEAVSGDTILISVIHTCNETGAKSPVCEFAAAADRVSKTARKRPLLHCDAVQAFGKEDLTPERWGIDLMTVSAHKVFGPKGIGALYVGKDVGIRPVFHGGGQEKGLRPGTEPVELITAFAAAVGEFGDLQRHRESVTRLKERIVEGLSQIQQETGRGLPVLSPPDGSPYILSFSAGGVRSETMLHFLESRGIYVSSGSACSKGKPSRVLLAMGVPGPVADCALRLSFSKHNTPDQAQRFLRAVKEGLSTLAVKA